MRARLDEEGIQRLQRQRHCSAQTDGGAAAALHGSPCKHAHRSHHAHHGHHAHQRAPGRGGGGGGGDSGGLARKLLLGRGVAGLAAATLARAVAGEGGAAFVRIPMRAPRRAAADGVAALKRAEPAAAPGLQQGSPC